MSQAWWKLKEMYDAWESMTKYKSASFSLHPPQIFIPFLDSHNFLPFS